MTLQFPLSLADFWDQLPMQSCSMHPVEFVETSGVASGQTLSRELAPTIWRGTVSLGSLTTDEMADVMPLIDLAQRTGASFLACDRYRSWPALDPTGNVLGAATVTIDAVSANRRELILEGLPPNYPLRRGDMIGVQWGANPVRYGLHRIVVPASADGTGRTGWNEVTPAYETALQPAAPASLARPPIKAIIDPGSVRRGGRAANGLHDGIGFSFSQTVR